jgi:hypothetical protein
MIRGGAIWVVTGLILLALYALRVVPVSWLCSYPLARSSSLCQRSK